MRERSSIDRLLRPRTIAVVGASTEPFSLGANVMANFDAFGYGGELFPVSRRYQVVDGIASCSSIADLPEGIDLAALVVPAAAVRDAVAGCAAKGVGAAVIFASGFAELGEQGTAEQLAIAEIARGAGMAVLGPNCLGFINFAAGVPLTFERVQPTKLTGSGVAVVAQSGAMTGNIREALRSRGLPVAYAISTGNEAVIGAEDVLSALAEDPAVGSFSVFVEQIREPQAFMRFARQAWQLGKPVVLMHPGRSQRSREAAQSHTGAMAGDHAVMETFLGAAGVTLVDSFDGLFDTTVLRHRYPQARISGFGIVTNSGAVRGFSLDFCEELGLLLPQLATQTAETLSNVLPDFATIDNPLDITAMGMSKPSLFGDTSAAMLADPQMDALLVAAMGGAPKQVMAKWESLKPVLSGSAKPVALAFLGDELPMPKEFLDDIRAAGVTFFRSPERAMRAFANMGRTGYLDHIPVATRTIPTTASVVAEFRGKEMLRGAGFPVPEGDLAADKATAIRIAERIGYPVALKAQADTISHKSDLGGVKLRLDGPTAVERAWDEVTASLAAHGAASELDGMLVERMAAPFALELVISARRDPSWGVVLTAGLGGVWTELMHDIVMMPAGLPDEEILKRLLTLKGARLLTGYRGSDALDVASVAEVLARLGRFLIDDASLAEVEINPLAVYPEGQGVVILDVLARRG